MRRENKAEETCEEISQGIFRIDTRHKSTDSRSTVNRLHTKTNNQNLSVYHTKTAKNKDKEKILKSSQKERYFASKEQKEFDN